MDWYKKKFLFTESVDLGHSTTSVRPQNDDEHLEILNSQQNEVALLFPILTFTT